MVTRKIDLEPEEPLPDDPSVGRCPSCDTPGLIGARCEVKACRSGGYHVVPRGAGASDRRVGRVVGPWLLTRLVDKPDRYAALRLATHEPATLRLVEVEDDAAARKLLADIAKGRQTTTLVGQPGVHVPGEVGAAPGLVYLVDDLPAGARTLQRVIDDRKRVGRAFSLVETLAVLEPVLAVLERAHRQRVLHLDLGPDQILVAPAGRSLDVRIMGYGRWASPGEEVRSRATLLDPFMAPEQIHGRAVGHAADLYAVAVIAFELLTLRRPFSQGGRIHEDKARPAREVLAPLGLAELGPALVAFFERALDPDPRRRFADAQTLGRQLERAMSGQRAEDDDDDDATTTMILADRSRGERAPRPSDDEDTTTMILGSVARADAAGDDDDATSTVILGKPGSLDTVFIDMPKRRR